MRKHNLTQIVNACHLCFTGLQDQVVAQRLNVSPSTVCRWRKLPVWKQTEEILIEKTIEQKINSETAPNNLNKEE